MPDFKENIHYLLKKHHLGKERAITIRDLAMELMPIQTNDREIRQAIRDLNMEGVPILASVNYPVGVFYGQSNIEIEEYINNLESRIFSMFSRVKSLNAIRAKSIVIKQLNLFEGP